MAPVSFRNSKIVYYGPHSCENCGINIVKMGREWGGTAFTAPEGPIYPNTEWHPHVCDPALVKQRLGNNAAIVVRESFPHAVIVKVGQLGYVVLGEDPSRSPNHALVISTNQCYHATPEGAWAGALERMEKGYPTWHIDLSAKANAKFSDDLQRLPECPN